MLKVELTQAPRKHLAVNVTRNGEIVYMGRIDPLSERSRLDLAKKIRIAPDTVLRWCHTGAGTYEHEETEASTTLSVRFHDEAGGSEAATGEPLQLLRDVFSNRSTGFVRWDDPQSMACLDLDYHLSPAPTPERLQFLMARVQPAPSLWWRSRGGGAHAIYLRRGNLTADVLAAAAGFAFTVLDNVATFEVLNQTRVAGGADLHEVIPTEDMSVLRAFLSGGVSPADVEEWLEGKGLERNKAYEHKFCPVAGYSESKGTPVWVGEHGIQCHRCAALGITFGSHNAGFFPYATLCGSRRLNEVAQMVQNFTHWEHAQIVMESRCRLRGKTARLAYEGLLRLWHEEGDERIDKVFTAGRNVIRGLGRWVTPGRNETLLDIRNTLAGLPAVLNTKGKPYPERLDMFLQGVDLCDYGYTSIRPLHGMRVFGEFLGVEAGPITNIVVKSTDPQLAPRYTPADQRLPMDVAWARVDAVFPGISRKFIQLLIAARGVSEGEIGIVPNLLVIGPASTGKTSTVAIAASMLGDGCTEVPWNINPERFRQGYIEGVDRGSFICVNELIKDAISARKSPRSAFDYFLNLTPDSVSHKLFVGPVQLGRIPVTVVSDTYIPGDIRADIQLARRFVYVRLDARIDWETTLITSGVRQMSNFRTSSVENAEASNAIVSDVIDQFFRTEPRHLSNIAKELGFDTLENCDEPLDDPDALATFFRKVCDTPDSEDPALKGRGWKKVRIDEPDESELATAWRGVCDGEKSLIAFCSSRRCMEVDWSTIVPVPVGSRLDISRRGKSVAFRFRYGETRGSGVYNVNGELLTCDGERRG